MRMPGKRETHEVGTLAVEELDALDSRPISRPTPEYLLWLGCARHVLHLRVRIFEQTDKGRWRVIAGLKPFRVHYRQDSTLPRLIMKARRKYGMGNDVWKLTGREFNEERAVCLFAAPGFRPRKIECIVLERTRALTKKQGQHLAALINRAIRKNGIGVLEEDEAVRKMKADLLFNCFLLETGDYREKDGKKICTIRAIDLNVWRKDGGKRDRMESVILHILGSARRKKQRQAAQKRSKVRLKA